MGEPDPIDLYFVGATRHLRWAPRQRPLGAMGRTP